MSPQELAYAGVYRLDEKTRRTVLLDGGKLYSLRDGGSRLEIFPVAKDQFRFRGSFTSMSFERDSAGNVAAMVLDSGGTTSRAPKTDEQPVTRTAITADPAKLDRYTGSYEPGPGLLMVISRKGNALAALVGSGQREFDLFAESESTWFAKAVDI